MKTTPTTVFDTYSDYIRACDLSCPDPFPDGFARYQAGAWYAQGGFVIKDKTTIPTREQAPEFWDGYDSEIKL